MVICSDSGGKPFVQFWLRHLENFCTRSECHLTNFLYSQPLFIRVELSILLEGTMEYMCINFFLFLPNRAEKFCLKTFLLSALLTILLSSSELSAQFR